MNTMYRKFSDYLNTRTHSIYEQHKVLFVDIKTGNFEFGTIWLYNFHL